MMHYFTAIICYQNLNAFDLAGKKSDYLGMLNGRKSLNRYKALAIQYTKKGQLHKNAMLSEVIRASFSLK